MNKITFYEEFLEEFRKRQESAGDRKKLKLETADRGNLAVLSELVSEDGNEQYLSDCRKLDDSELCWKLFNTLHEHCSEQGMTEDEQALDATRFKGYRLKHAMGHLHAFRCVGKEEFPEWFFLHEKLKRHT